MNVSKVNYLPDNCYHLGLVSCLSLYRVYWEHAIVFHAAKHFYTFEKTVRSVNSFSVNYLILFRHKINYLLNS